MSQAVPAATTKRWGELSAWLLQIEENGSWQADAPSFTAWIDQYAAKTKRLPSSIWRLVSMGRYYNEIRAQATQCGIALPPLKELDQRVSPENLELLRKLERVAPPDFVQSMKEQVLRGEAKRVELRAAWRSYRQVMGTATARGRGLEKPRVSVSEGMQMPAWHKANVVQVLLQNGRKLLNAETSDVFRVLPHFAMWLETPHLPEEPAGEMSVDAVVVAGKRSARDLDLHGIEIVSGLDELYVCRLSTLSDLLDYLWVVMPSSEIARLTQRPLPDEIGCLTWQDSGLSVVREAKPHFIRSDLQNQLLRQLLLHGI